MVTVGSRLTAAQKHALPLICVRAPQIYTVPRMRALPVAGRSSAHQLFRTSNPALQSRLKLVDRGAFLGIRTSRMGHHSPVGKLPRGNQRLTTEVDPITWFRGLWQGGRRPVRPSYGPTSIPSFLRSRDRVWMVTSCLALTLLIAQSHDSACIL